MLAKAMELLVQDRQEFDHSRLEQNKYSEDFRGEYSSSWRYYNTSAVAKTEGSDYKNFRSR